MSWRVGANEKDPCTHTGALQRKVLAGATQGVVSLDACGSNFRDLSQEDRRPRHSADRVNRELTILFAESTEWCPLTTRRLVTRVRSGSCQTHANRRRAILKCWTGEWRHTQKFLLGTGKFTTVNVDDKGRSRSGVSRKPTTVNVDEEATQK